MNGDRAQQKPVDSEASANILVVDDEPRLLQSLIGLLSERGFAADAALGGKAACKMLMHSDYDLVLLDLRMADMNGHQVMDFMTEQGIPAVTIVVSGESSFAAVSRALRRGAHDYIKKPFDADELLATVRNALDKRSLERAHEDVQVRLKKSEELHRYIVNSSPDIVFMLDRQGNFCFLNSKVEVLLGYGCGPGGMAEPMGRNEIGYGQRARRSFPASHIRSFVKQGSGILSPFREYGYPDTDADKDFMLAQLEGGFEDADQLAGNLAGVIETGNFR